SCSAGAASAGGCGDSAGNQSGNRLGEGSHPGSPGTGGGTGSAGGDGGSSGSGGGRNGTGGGSRGGGGGGPAGFGPRAGPGLGTESITASSPRAISTWRPPVNLGGLTRSSYKRSCSSDVSRSHRLREFPEPARMTRQDLFAQAEVPPDRPSLRRASVWPRTRR